MLGWRWPFLVFAVPTLVLVVSSGSACATRAGATSSGRHGADGRHRHHRRRAAAVVRRGPTAWCGPSAVAAPHLRGPAVPRGVDHRLRLARLALCTSRCLGTSTSWARAWIADPRPAGRAGRRWPSAPASRPVKLLAPGVHRTWSSGSSPSPPGSPAVAALAAWPRPRTIGRRRRGQLPWWSAGRSPSWAPACWLSRCRWPSRPGPARSGFSIGALFVLPGLLALPLIGWIGTEWGFRWGIAVLVAGLPGRRSVHPGLGRVGHRATTSQQVWAGAATRAQMLHERAAGHQKLLLVRGLDVRYGDVRILFGVDIEVEEGEVVALLGTNGAGKSTLLNAISGVTQASRGAVIFDGRDITHAPPDEIAALGISQVPGGKGVFPGLTVAENLRVAGWMARDDRAGLAARRERVHAMFPILADRSEDPATDLSGGQQQMLALSMAFLTKPQLLVIDELSLGLAPVIVDQLLDVVRALRDEGTTILLVEQSVNVALSVADRAYFLEKGEVRYDGPTADLLDRPDVLRSVFLEGASKGLGLAETTSSDDDEPALFAGVRGRGRRRVGRQGAGRPAGRGAVGALRRRGRRRRRGAGGAPRRGRRAHRAQRRRQDHPLRPDLRAHARRRGHGHPRRPGDLGALARLSGPGSGWAARSRTPAVPLAHRRGGHRRGPRAVARRARPAQRRGPQPGLRGQRGGGGRRGRPARRPARAGRLPQQVRGRAVHRLAPDRRPGLRARPPPRRRAARRAVVRHRPARGRGPRAAAAAHPRRPGRLDGRDRARHAPDHLGVRPPGRPRPGPGRHRGPARRRPRPPPTSSPRTSAPAPPPTAAGRRRPLEDPDVRLTRPLGWRLAGRPCPRSDDAPGPPRGRPPLRPRGGGRRGPAAGGRAGHGQGPLGRRDRRGRPAPSRRTSAARRARTRR
jgi:ABC-type branched-subunit amino acid transport system ATPase component